MTIAYLNVQCTEESGETGCFLSAAKGTKGQPRKAITPIFPDLADAFRWMHANGWSLDERLASGEFDPWRCSKAV